MRKRAARSVTPRISREQLGDVGGVGGVGAGEPGGGDPGRAVEGGDLEPGVVGEGGDPGDRRDAARLEQGVALQRRLRLGDVGPVETGDEPASEATARRGSTRSRPPCPGCAEAHDQPVDLHPPRRGRLTAPMPGSGPALQVDQLGDAGVGEVEHLVELGAA